MNRLEMIQRVRSHTRDLTNAVFREIDIISFLNEGIDRIIQVIPELSDMKYLTANDESPIILPKQYHHLIPVYSTARCFAQDDRPYQAGTLMNEFETKLSILESDLLSGDVVILNPETGLSIISGDAEYSLNTYFPSRRDYVGSRPRYEQGVEGVDY